VLGITVPNPHAHPHHSLLYELGTHWPDYAAYTISFLTIGIIWINHHAMINRLRDADYTILILNLLLLMSIGILPFATDLMATYLREPSGRAVAAAVYAGAFLLMSVMFSSLNRTILIKRAHLSADDMSLDRRRQVLRRSVIGSIPYAIAVALAPVSAYATLAICAAVALYYARPFASST
jgi:uncharacterized membrane protein